MTILFVILIVLASIILSLIVLIQNPKGGGLSGNIAGFSNQFMGVKQTNDVLEKGTWIFGAVVGVLAIASIFFIQTGVTKSGVNTEKYQNMPGGGSTPAPGNTVPLNGETAPANTPAVPDSI